LPEAPSEQTHLRSVQPRRHQTPRRVPVFRWTRLTNPWISFGVGFRLAEVSFVAVCRVPCVLWTSSLLSTPPSNLSWPDSTHRLAPLHASSCWTFSGSVAFLHRLTGSQAHRQRTRAPDSARSKPHPAPSPSPSPSNSLDFGTCDLRPAIESSPAKTAAIQKWTSAQAPPPTHTAPIRLPNPPSGHQNTRRQRFDNPTPAADPRPPIDLLPYHCDGLRPRLSLPADPPAFSSPVVRRRLPPLCPFPTSPSLGPATFPSPTPTGDRLTALCCFSVATIEIAHCQTLRLNTALSSHLDIDVNPRLSVCRLPRPSASLPSPLLCGCTI